MAKRIAIAGVYAILCTINRKFYIGSSSNVMRRIAEHRSQLRRNEHALLPRLQQDWNAFGESAFAFIHFVCAPDNYRRYENHLIAMLDTLEHQQGYNKMLCGKWGPEASIRNIEKKLIQSGLFHRFSDIDAETPMSRPYIQTFNRSS